MRIDSEPRRGKKGRWLPTALMVAGLASGTGGFAISQNKEVSWTAAATGNNTVELTSSGVGAQSVREDLYSGHQMTGEFPAKEFHCSVSADQPPSLITTPGLVFLRLRIAPNMDLPLTSRDDVEKVEGVLKDTNNPKSEPKEVRFEKAFPVTVDGDPPKTPEWQVVTRMKAGVIYSLRVKITESGTGTKREVVYDDVFLPKKAA